MRWRTAFCNVYDHIPFCQVGREILLNSRRIRLIGYLLMLKSLEVNNQYTEKLNEAEMRIWRWMCRVFIEKDRIRRTKCMHLWDVRATLQENRLNWFHNMQCGAEKARGKLKRA